MNILILNWKDVKNPAAGGAEYVAFLLAKKLVAEGNEVTFFCRGFEHAKEYETIDGVPVIRRGSSLSVYYKAYAYYQSLKTKPDVVIDMVNTICWQTPLYVPKNKRLLYVNQLAKEVWFYQKPFPISWIGYLLEKIEYLTYRKTHAICYSQGTKYDLVSVGIPEKNISLFPLGIDHEVYKLGKQKEKTPLFLFVGRLVKMKRADLCIKAFAQVQKTHKQARLVIIGNGPEEHALQALINTYHLQKHVQILTHIADGVKRDYMQKAWAIVVPSVKEGWGMIVTEAAACGTPAIVTKVTGLTESVQQDKTGIIIPSNPHPISLARAMMQMMDKKKQQEFSKQSLLYAQKFTWEKSFATFKEVITNIYGKK